MLADSHGHLFVTTGGNSVDVLASDGSTLPPIPVVASFAMALSPDGSTLYVTGQAGISTVDTTSLTVTRVYPMAACASPMSLAFVGAALWFGGARCGSGPIGTIALVTGTVTTIALSNVMSVVATPGDSTTLLTYSADTEVLTRWLVSGTSATAATHTTVLVNDVAVDPVSGDVLITDANSAVIRLKMSDLTPDGSYPSEPRSLALATSPALGGLMAVGAESVPTLGPPPTNVEVFRGGVATRSLSYGHQGAVMLAWTPDGSRLYALLYDSFSATYSIEVLVGAGTLPTTLAVTGPPTAPRAVPLTLSGTLLQAGTPLAGQTVSWSRTDLSGTTPLGALTTTTSGGFTATDTPQVGGAVSYTFAYAGDTNHAPATATVTVNVARLATLISISVNGRVFPYAGLATTSVHLGPTAASRRIQVWEYVYGVPNPHFALVYQGNVNSSGNYAFAVHMYRHISYAAMFVGDAYNAPAAAYSYTTALARITPVLYGAYATSGSYHYYHHTVNPEVVGVISPARGAIGCMNFSAQVYLHSTWTTGATSTCLPITASNLAVAYLVGAHPTGVPYRVRAYTPSDIVNAATSSGWVYLEFTT